MALVDNNSHSNSNNITNSTPDIIRPQPRRPFRIDLMSSSLSPPPSSPPSPSLQSSSLQSPSLGRSQSIVNLTTSTLFGIYAPVPSSRGEDPLNNDTPWGTGAQTPAPRQGLDEGTLELMRSRLHGHHPRLTTDVSSALVSSSTYSSAYSSTLSAHLAWLAGFVAPRVGLLFLLGIGYAVLVSRLHDGRDPTTSTDDYNDDDSDAVGHAYRYDWRYFAFWGVSGVLLGALLPWLDGVWESFVGRNFPKAVGEDGTDPNSLKPAEAMDWALVVRGVGAFVGIVFAIRKLPWASTLQVSVTLALTNPFLWYLIDRSKTGFLLSAAVGLAGSTVMVGLSPGIMLTPSSLAFAANQNSSHHDGNDGGTGGSLGGNGSDGETLEAAIWVLSVLFCSCLCFGNIGRRLALNRSATGKGRWGGER